MKAVRDSIQSYIRDIAMGLGVPAEQIVESLTFTHGANTNVAISAEDAETNTKGKTQKDNGREGLCKQLSASANKIGLAICDKKGIQWKNLLHILSQANAYIDNYPDIPILGEGNLGICSLTNDEQQ
jgi:hypothetical protein